MTKLDTIKALLEDGSDDKKSTSEFWKVGSSYIVRTVTMIYVGKLKALNATELLLKDCAWIPETSRWNEFVNGKDPNEMEPYKNDVIISRGALLDATVYDGEFNIKVI